jgi:DNA-directed RNA polymerase subunit RPC12/RpoP
MSEQLPVKSMDAARQAKCPRCGESSTGRFCANCGAPLRGVACPTCGHDLSPGAKFCNECGTPVAAGRAPNAAPSSDRNVVRLIGGAAVIVLIAFVAGEAVGRRSGAPDVAVAEQGSAPPTTGIVGAPDISAMSPEERASRLFNRVMSYSEQGKLDSARFFAPMAVQAYQMIGPPDAHARYDIGEIYAAVGDAASARAEADTILTAQPNHLLGLALGARAADLAGDAAAAARFRRRLAAAAPAERAKGLKEYSEHARDIDAALKREAP